MSQPTCPWANDFASELEHKTEQLDQPNTTVSEQFTIFKIMNNLKMLSTPLHPPTPKPPNSKPKSTNTLRKPPRTLHKTLHHEYPQKIRAELQ